MWRRVGWAGGVIVVVLVIVALIAGAMAYEDPWYYSYAYTPMMPWAPAPYSYAYQQGYYQPGTHYTSVYVHTTNNTWVAPAKPPTAPGKPNAVPAPVAPKPVAPTGKRPSGNPAAPVQRAPAPAAPAPKRPSGNPAAPVNRPAAPSRPSGGHH